MHVDLSSSTPRVTIMKQDSLDGVNNELTKTYAFILMKNSIDGRLLSEGGMY